MVSPFGGFPDRFDPEGGPSSRRALVVPGLGYSPAHPLLEYSRLALLQHGWSVRQLWWDVPAELTDADRDAWVAAQVRAAMHADAQLAPEPARWLVVAKSLGTRAVSADLGADAYVLLTPLLTDGGVVDRIREVRRAGVPVLLVGGSADRVWSGSVAASLDCEVLEVEGADHMMAVHGDVVRTTEVHAEVTRALVRFLADRS